MTPEQYQELLRRFDDLSNDVRATRADLRGEIDSLRDELQSFTSDVHDRLSRRIAKVAAFVRMPAKALADSEPDIG